MYSTERCYREIANLRSNEHYLSSSENKAWKKFRPELDLNPWPLRYRRSALPTENWSLFWFQINTWSDEYMTVNK